MDTVSSISARPSRAYSMSGEWNAPLTGSGIARPSMAPGQIVISGDVEAVERATGAIEGRAMPLSVSGAFHSPLMEYAREGLAEMLDTVSIDSPRCPVYPNVTAEPTTDPDEIRQRLTEQLLSPVRWAPLPPRSEWPRPRACGGVWAPTGLATEAAL